MSSESILNSCSILLPSESTTKTPLFGSTTDSMIILNNVPSFLAYGTNLMNFFSATNEYAYSSTAANVFYLKFTTTFTLPNPNLSNNGQLAIYLYLQPYNSTTTPSFGSSLYDVVVTLECNGTIQTSPIYSPTTIQYTQFSNTSDKTTTIPIYLTNLFPQLLQDVNTIYKITVEAWQANQQIQ